MLSDIKRISNLNAEILSAKRRLEKPTFPKKTRAAESSFVRNFACDYPAVKTTLSL